MLFCDLVGFTSRAESLDPEDVEAILRPYHARVRAELERHGGTVEKFIGDAVMALFGAPVAHEDDPERAVRAALAIRDFAVEESLELRVGITTGEALVSLDASPLEGEGMASGDVVNTAARLQSAAPVNGILADVTTHRATRQSIEYRDAPPVAAKGKSDPIPVREAVAARSRFGVDVTHHARTELVGRDRELALLRDALDRARHELVPQLLTLVGVPGMGKSRLVYELSQIADADPEIITWRQGRCLAYGDGIAFWALGEVVKAQAGILERDGEDEAAEKLRAAVVEVLGDANDGTWVESHLRPLVGLEAEAGLGGDRRGEAFAAWRRFLEALAEQRPFVLVLEDLHWADDGLLDFVDELVGWLTGVPLLVVCTARPELLERRPGWGGGKLNVSTLGLSPLSHEQTAVLISRVLERAVLPAEIQQGLLERSNGNPLYAEQFAQLQLERGSGDDLALPETLQGIIAARLDGLSSHEKAVLQDASVMGKVFWTGALRRDEREATPLLHALERKGFLTRQRRSSIEREGEWSFAHMLLRDVAYGQIPRAERAAKHALAAEWIESLGRADDHAELVAFHCNAALELAHAAGATTIELAGLAGLARVAARAAGDRAFALSAFPAAAMHYDKALALWPEDDADRPELLFSRAQALFNHGDESTADALESARDALVQSGRLETAAEAEALLARMFWLRGQQDEVFPHLDAAEALIEGADASPGVARVLALSTRHHMLAGEEESGLRFAEEALAMAEGLGLEDLRVHALTTIGSAKEFLSDITGRKDLERAIEIGRAANSPMLHGALNNLSVVIDTWDVVRVRELEGLREAERFGDVQITRFMRGNLIVTSWLLGEWDEAVTDADAFIAECETSAHILEDATRLVRAYITLARARRDDALADFNRALELARGAARDRDTLIPALIRTAWAYLQVGRVAEARMLFGEAVPLLEKHPKARPWALAEVAFELGETSEVRKILTALPSSPGHRAMVAVLDGEFEMAAGQYAEARILLFEAEARLRAAEQLLAEGRSAEGEVQLEQALAFYHPIGATLFIQRGERLLAKSA